MFHRVLVPLDGSARAERALPVAARLARTLDGTLILVRVVQPPLQPATSLAPLLDVETSILLERRNAAAAYLTHVAHHPDLAGIKHEQVALVGYPAEMILDAVHASRADIIILCSHGRTGLLRWALGSVAQRVIHHAPVPVLVLHEQGPIPDAQRPLRALVPLDGSWLAEAALGPAAALVSALAPRGQGRLHLVQVVAPPSAEREENTQAAHDVRDRDAVLRQAQDYLRRTAEHLLQGPLAHLQIEITWSALVDQDVAGVLIDLAQSGTSPQGTENKGRFDLVVMALHGQGGWHRWVMGSVTERVLQASKIPLLVIRPKEMTVTSLLHSAQTPKEATPINGIL